MKLSQFRLEPPSALATLALLLAPTAVATAQEQPPAASRPLLAAVAPPLTVAATPAPDAAVPGATPAVTETEIVATQGADFDSRSRVATFTGTVHVADPRFELWCDKLTVFLNKPADKKGNAPAVPTPPPVAAPEGEKKEGDNGGIDHAVADGHVVIVQHKSMDKNGNPLPETGNGAPKTSIGRAEHALFKNQTGDMTLTGSPRVQQDTNEHVGAPGTTMILGRDNTLKTFGPSRTVIRQKAEEAGTKKEKKPAATAAPTPTPGRRRG